MIMIYTIPYNTRPSGTFFRGHAPRQGERGRTENPPWPHVDFVAEVRSFLSFLRQAHLITFPHSSEFPATEERPRSLSTCWDSSASPQPKRRYWTPTWNR